MSVIIGVNPVPKKNRVKKRKGFTMAKRKKTKQRRRQPAAPKTVTKWRTKTLTKWRERRKRRAARRVSLSGPNRMNMRIMLRDGCAIAGGMIMAKVCVNKLTAGGSERDRWTWPNIAMAAGSGVAGAMILGALLRLKKPTVACIALGGVSLAIYKIFTTKMAPRWNWTEDWFGADEDLINPELLGADEDDDEFEVVDYDPDESMGASPYHRRRPLPPARRRPGLRPPVRRHRRPPMGSRLAPPPAGHRPPPRGRRPSPVGRRPHPPGVIPLNRRRRPPRMHGDEDYDMMGYTNTGGQIVPVNPAFGEDYDMGYTNTGGQVVPVNPVFGDDYEYADQM